MSQVLQLSACSLEEAVFFSETCSSFARNVGRNMDSSNGRNRSFEKKGQKPTNLILKAWKLGKESTSKMAAASALLLSSWCTGGCKSAVTVWLFWQSVLDMASVRISVGDETLKPSIIGNYMSNVPWRSCRFPCHLIGSAQESHTYGLSTTWARTRGVLLQLKHLVQWPPNSNSVKASNRCLIS